MLVLALLPGTKLMTPGRFRDGSGFPELADRAGPVLFARVSRSAPVAETQMLLVAPLVEVTVQKLVFQLVNAGVCPET